MLKDMEKQRPRKELIKHSKTNNYIVYKCDEMNSTNVTFGLMKNCKMTLVLL